MQRLRREYFRMRLPRIFSRPNGGRIAMSELRREPYLEKLLKLGASVEPMPSGNRLVLMDSRVAGPRKLNNKLKIEISSNGCWNWRATVKPDGYGMIYISGRKSQKAHRFFYEKLIGPIPTGLCIDHLCRNRCCVNPTHLEPVTHKENTLRGIGLTAVNKKKTHCYKGHPYTPENMTSEKKFRQCRTCILDWNRAKRARLKMEATCKTQD